MSTKTTEKKKTSLLTHLKRNFAYLTLAFTDVSKSALANQKEQGIQADQAMTQSAWSEAKHTISDMKAGRQTRQTAEMAEGWWRSHVRAQRSAYIDGTYRELTDEEWTERCNRLAEPGNKDKGDVMLMHHIRRMYDDQAGIEYTEEGDVRLNNEKLQASRKDTAYFEAKPGHFFPPLDAITVVFVRKSEENYFTVELHTDIVASEPEFHLAQDPTYTHLLPEITRVAMVLEEYSGLVLRSFSLQGRPRVTVHNNVLVFTFAAEDELPTPVEVSALTR